MIWNILIVDDDGEQARTTKEIVCSRRTLAAGDTIKGVVAAGFAEALELIEYSRFDLIILDLKDEAEDEDTPDAELSGERVLAQLRLRQFTPVIFYTGFPQKVENKKGPFIKVVGKGSDAEELRGAIRQIFETRLPDLIRHIQEEQRKYLWDHIDQSAGGDHGQPNELAFLLGRRLSNALAGKAIRRFFDKGNLRDDHIAHPIELYVWPPMTDSVGFGDILEKTEAGSKRYFVVLNPACDFAQCKAEKALLAECDLLATTSEYVAIEDHKSSSKEAPSRALTSSLKALLSDNRQGKKVQPERYKFLPGTSFLPNLVVDYQKLIQIPIAEINPQMEFLRIATLDTPYAEALQSRYIRYYGRVGTPDLEWDSLVADMLK